MALEKYLQPVAFEGELPAIKGEDRYVSEKDAKFDFAKLRSSVDYQKELGEMDLTSGDGLKKYSETVLGKGDHRLLNLPYESVERTRKGLVQKHLQGTREHGFNFAQDLTSLVETPQLLGFSLSKMPLYKAENSGKDYVSVVDTYENSRKTVEGIKEDPKKHIEKRFEKLNDYSKYFFQIIAKDIVEGDINAAVNSSIKAADKYGLPKFVADNWRTAHYMADLESAESEAIGELMEAEKTSRLEGTGRERLTAGEAAEINDKYSPEIEKIGKKYNGAAGTVGKLADTIIGMAIGSAEQREKIAELKAAEDAKKAA